jgi:hypothetical protein
VRESSAVVVAPGVEENKAPYWRVYFTTVNFRVGQQLFSLSLNTMISWRGSWYVVHVIGFG